MDSFITMHVQPIAAFVSNHTLIGGAVVFFLALSESLPVIGAVVPGTATILAISAMAGVGCMSVWTVLLAAVSGAIIGDGIAYWFGHRYKVQALNMWPMSRHPAVITRSEEFFARHGGKSIAIARFTPVVRAFVPLIAGVSGMSAVRFYSANVASAVVWAVSHVVPAAAAGELIGTLPRIGGQLVAMLLTLTAFAFVLRWVVRQVRVKRPE